MKTRTLRSTVRFLLIIFAVLAFVDEGIGAEPRRRDAADSGPPNPAAVFTSPPPVFQRGNQLSLQLPDSHPEVRGFLDFYSGIVINKLGGTAVPSVAYTDLVSFPPRYLDIADNGGNAASGKFSSSLVCQTCHDSDWTKTGQYLPNMSFWAQGSPAPNGGNPHDLAANWSLFGDWSGSIKALAGRDPVFLAQVESTRQINSGIKPVQIDNLCFRCHSPLGQRQITAAQQPFDHFMLYSTAAGSGYNNPFPDQAGTDPKYADIGALARDGVDCAACHTIQPKSGLPWNGQDFAVFYGDDGNNPFGGDVVNRIRSMSDSPDHQPPPYPFTAMMNTQPSSVVGPDDQLNASPMSKLHLQLAYAATKDSSQSYLRDGTVCGSCHAVILPTVPTDYKAGGPIPAGYNRPASCTQEHTTFKADGDYMTDPCVGLDYEQTTYFEWINSGYSSGTATCMTCHMPTASTQATKANQYVAQCNADLAMYYGDPQCKADSAKLTPRQYNRHALLGINLFVEEMFQQYSDVLGTRFYGKTGSVVPPYLLAASQSQGPGASPTGNLVDNPGAENGNAQGWAADSKVPYSQINAVQSGGAGLDPHSGKFYFLFAGTVTRTIDLTPYASLIDAGGASAVVTGFIRSESRYIHSEGGPSLPVTASLSFAAAPSGANSAPISSSLHAAWQGGSPATIPLAPGDRKIIITASSIIPDQPNVMNAGQGTQGGLDDLSVVLQPGAAQPGPPPQDANRNYQIPNNLLNAEQSIVDLALNRANGAAGTGVPAVQVSIDSNQITMDPVTKARTLTVKVSVTNNAGHKFPSGAPFRRAFVELQLLDQYGGVVWASGQPNAYGAICNGPCSADGSNVLDSEFTTDVTLLQPHYDKITQQNQVQIYELRATDDQCTTPMDDTTCTVTSQELQIFHVVKDNRLLPQYWTPPEQVTAGTTVLGLDLQHLAQLTRPIDKVPNSQLKDDADYSDPNMTGVDHLTYVIPLPGDGGPTVKRIQARVNYQSIPPGYLASRFKEAGNSKLTMGHTGPAMQRLIYMTSRLNLNLGLDNVADPGNPKDFVKNWTMVLSEASQPLNHAQGAAMAKAASRSRIRRPSH